METTFVGPGAPVGLPGRQFLIVTPKRGVV